MQNCPHCDLPIEAGFRDNATALIKAAPAELTHEQKEELKKKQALSLKKRKQNVTVAGVLLVAGVPLAALWQIGPAWAAMATGVATCCVMGTIIATGVIFVITGIKLDWFE